MGHRHPRDGANRRATQRPTATGLAVQPGGIRLDRVEPRRTRRSTTVRVQDALPHRERPQEEEQGMARVPLHRLSVQIVRAAALMAGRQTKAGQQRVRVPRKLSNSRVLHLRGGALQPTVGAHRRPGADADVGLGGG